MECDKLRALRARIIAEYMFAGRNLNGARRFALLAKFFYPALEGIQQFIETLDVFIAAQRRINGEVDWHSILGVEPSSDDDTIRRQYRRLALTLHPDRNKSFGAEGAFRLLSEAWNRLSSRFKKVVCDQNQISRGIDNASPDQKPPEPTAPNSSRNFSNHNNSSSRVLDSAMHSRPAQRPRISRPDTFWTMCDACKTRFEYLRSYLNHNLRCQNCRQPFIAAETPAPPKWRPCMPGPNSTQHSNVENSGAASSTAPADMLKRRREEAPTTAMKVDFSPRQTKTGSGSAAGSSSAGVVSEMKGDKLKKKRCGDGHQPSEFNYQNCSSEAGRRNIYQSFTGELSQQEFRSLLISKAKKDICGKIKERSTASSFHETIEKEMEEDQEKLKAVVKDIQADTNGCPDHENVKTKTISIQYSPVNSADGPDMEVNNSLSMSVPDPDFHDFDKDRLGKSFSNYEIWAAYDGDDGMPRYYALIHRVISLEPFEVQFSWLNSKSNREFGPLKWIGAGFHKTSGEFWIGKRQVTNSINSFSHKICKWTKGARGSVHIYPAKGDVWALYRNWSADWNVLTPDDVVHNYDMVEILEDYTNARGLTVAPLVKVAGFKTVFRRDSDASKIMTIPREEMFRFSHQVPSFMLTGQEGCNAPKGCWELDPASTPLELLQVLTENQLKDMESTGKAKEQVVVLSEDVEKPKEEQLVVNDVATKGKAVLEDATGTEAAFDRKTKGKEIKEDKQLLVYKRRRFRK